MMQTVLNYLGGVMALSVGVSSFIHAFGLDKTKPGKVVLQVCIDLVGLGKAVLAMKEPQA